MTTMMMDDDNNNNTAMGSVHARGDTFLTFGLKALTETDTSRLATGIFKRMAMEDHHWGGQVWNSAVEPEEDDKLTCCVASLNSTSPRKYGAR
jgi:hypothetical protein